MSRAPETLRRDLAHALRTGPFSAALHLAIEASDLSLQEVQQRLMDTGVMISLATLSLWRRGRRRPQGPESAQAVRLLEEILGLPPEVLVSQLAPAQSRGQRVTQEAGVIELRDLWTDGGAIDTLLSDMDSRAAHELERISIHEIYTVGRHRQEESVLVRQVVRANVDNLARGVAIHQVDDPDAPLPTVTALSGCHIGRIRTDRVRRLIAVEVVFDRMLFKGDVAVTEFRLKYDSTAPTVDYHRLFSTGIEHYVLQVQFHPDAVPSRCYSYERRTENTPKQGVREVWIGTTNAAHVVGRNSPAGIVGMSWEWDEPVAR